ncbi:uroporphyrinogen-III synthase [Crenalkalicoccus roseus]|uniref:uroporphyrinogen-III synthase n=1 Tax=Crenalkalicoccus roseus TaxID=1485588 RepID=UPI001080722C|nr:uroporphyrinogen-III synthase [Crenalkalicoccus roseus]
MTRPEGEGRGAVLVTRPEPAAAETARRVAALGWRPVLAPALVLAPRPARLPPAQALLLTSRAAARALPPPDGGAPPVFAVGAATAEEARARGYAKVIAAGGDAASLTDLVAGRLDPRAGPLLLAVGEGYSLDLAAALRRRGFRVLRRVVYAAAPAGGLPAEARAALAKGEVVAALFFSPRSAECAISALRAAGLAGAIGDMDALAISPRVAAAARTAAAPQAWRRIRVANRPDQDSLLQLLHGTR